MRGVRRSTSRSDRGHIEALLDDALRMTFPASDPIAVDSAPARGEKETGNGNVYPSRPDSISHPER
jgi:hypothetical protein